MSQIPVRASARHDRRPLPCQLLDRCLSSSCDDAWRQLVGRYGARIRATLYAASLDVGLRPSPAELEEMVQELYLCWLRRGKPFQGRTVWHFWSFVSSSARHLAIDHVRKATAAKRCLELDPRLRPQRVAGILPDPDWPVLQLRMAGGSTPETRLLEQERHRGWMTRFRGLCRQVTAKPSGERALELAVLDGRSSHEVCAALRRDDGELTPREVDRWVHHLRRRLRSAGHRLPARHGEPPATWAPQDARAEG